VIKIHETTTPSGELAPVFLRFGEGVLEIVDAEGAFALPNGALDGVMARFGTPFDPEAEVTVIATLLLGEARALRHVRHLARYDVIARDYLVYDAPDREPLCALATTVAGALAHLGRVGHRHLRSS